MNGAVPDTTDEEIRTESPRQTWKEGVTEASGKANTVTVVLSVTEQPRLSVTVTVKV
jgi:hypothetical protein